MPATWLGKNPDDTMVYYADKICYSLYLFGHFDDLLSQLTPAMQAR